MKSRLTLTLTALLLAACAATPVVQHVRPIDTDFSKYSSLQVVVEAPDSVRALPGYDVTAATLRNKFVSDAGALGTFKSIGTNPQVEKSLEARLNITGFNYVSGASRGLVGIGAGHAVLNVTMTLKDTETGQVVGVIAAGHTSSHGQGAFSPTTSGQITAISKELSSRLAVR